MTLVPARTAVVQTDSPDATEAFGHRLGARLRAGDTVALVGPMGSGKTVLARGLARGAGATGYIASPSFVVIREYTGPVRVYHVDLYRIERADEVDQLALDELTEGTGIVIVEWADRAPQVLPAGHLRIDCAMGPGPSDRAYTLTIPASMADRLDSITGG